MTIFKFYFFLNCFLFLILPKTPPFIWIYSHFSSDFLKKSKNKILSLIFLFWTSGSLLIQFCNISFSVFKISIHVLTPLFLFILFYLLHFSDWNINLFSLKDFLFLKAIINWNNTSAVLHVIFQKLK